LQKTTGILCSANRSYTEAQRRDVSQDEHEESPDIPLAYYAANIS